MNLQDFGGVRCCRFLARPPFRSSTKRVALVVALCAGIDFVAVGAEGPPAPGTGAKSLFDGRTLANWEGNAKWWRVEDGCLTGGSLEETIPHNDFLASTRDFTNFVIRFQIKLTGSNGFINSGFQIRSQRVPKDTEMAGYQCDYGEPNWYGAVYDESRRNKVLSASDMKALRPALRLNNWNDYVIRADGPRVTTWINGVLGTDYLETDANIPDWGKFGIQVHGGGKALVQVRRIFIEELPSTPPGKLFRGAPEPNKGAKASPLTPAEELATFSLPPGFKVDLVAAEDMAAGFGKFVAVDWDWHGNLWTMTALEYPVDANENPAAARELYASAARDKVLVYDRNPQSPTGYARTPRVFAEGLAIPLGILPYRNGVYVQHGTEIVFLSDTNGDGTADKREVILSGFGVQDSHLFPHQFTRAPGNWIWMAQGAFNYGKVRTTTGREQQFDQTRMARFRYDGSEFDITSQGPCNIWGLVLDGNGQAWIQEANDFGYPLMPFHEYANYPGCSGAQWKSYAPEFPGTAPDFAMGGTGLSGLALSDRWPETPVAGPGPSGSKHQSERGLPLELGSIPSGFPPPYAGIFYIANPITRMIQAIDVTPDGARFRYRKLPDFMRSSDEWFRPVALRTGPDGCLYLVDWYNKIISHNEVPRNHPERDKKRGRIWRIRHLDQKLFDVPDFARIPGEALMARLGGASLPQSHLAWQAIVDRGLHELTPQLRHLVADGTGQVSRRLAALWALEGLKAVDGDLLKPLLQDSNRNVRREGARAAGEAGLPPPTMLAMFAAPPMTRDPDPEVRAEVIRSVGRFLAGATAPARQIDGMNAVRFLINSPNLEPIAGPTMPSTQSGRTIKTGDAYVREFERYLVRFFLEQQPSLVEAVLRTGSTSRPLENTVLATLALEPRTSATLLARVLPELPGRPLQQEEILRLAQFPGEPGVREALRKILQNSATGLPAIEALLTLRTRLDAGGITSLLTGVGRELLQNADRRKAELGVKLAGSFRLAALEPELVRVLESGWRGYPQLEREPYVLEPPALAALGALRDLKSDRVDLFAKLAEKAEPTAQNVAVAALAASRDSHGPEQLSQLYPQLPALSRRAALAALTATRPGASALVKSLRSGKVPKEELDGPALDKLHAVLGEDPDFAALMQEMGPYFRPALRLDGSDNAWADTDINLDGPFTVETWVKLDPGIDNNDGILGAPGVLDLNFFDGRFRVWVGGGLHDAIVAKKKIAADAWTHVAVTRDGSGNLRIYQNGELDSDQGKPAPQKFEHLRIGWTAPAQGTAGWLTEFRVWDRTRSSDEIRADFDRSFDGDAKPAGLVRYFPGAGPWGTLKSGARVIKTSDFPPLLTPAEAQALAEKFARYRSLAARPGDPGRGQATFKNVCMNCHSVGGQGGQVGPVLNGAGANGLEALLRNVLTPNAAMEAGYRAFRVELKDGEVLDGIRVSEDQNAIVLRRPNVDDLRIPQSTVKRAAFTKLSMMPEGLLEALKQEEVTDLFAYLQTLK